MRDLLSIGTNRRESMIGTGIGLGLSGYRLPPTAFAPSRVSGLELWLDASDSATVYQSNGGSFALSDGDSVGYWLDKSGNSRNAAQVSGTNKPAFKVSIQNGLNGIQFDAVNDFMQLDSGVTTTNFTFFFVSKFIADGGAGGSVFWGSGNTHSQNANYLNFGDGVFGGTDNSFEFYGPTSPSPLSMSVGSHINGNFRMYEVIKNGTGFSVNADSISVGTATGISNGITGNNFLGRYGATSDGYFSGIIGELLIYSSVIAGSNLSQIRNYLKSKWGTP